MIDVGVHYGESLERFAFGGWVVYAFEPDSRNRAILSAYCKKMTNVTIDPRAVTDKDLGNLPFYNSSVSTGISSLSSFHSTHKEIGHVPTVTLEKFIREKNMKNIGFLKVDTEGHDLFVLKGLDWEESVPEIILCQFENMKTKALGYDFDDLAGFLVGKGYHVLVSEWYPIIEYGTKHSWRRFVKYPCTLIDKKAWGNLIATKDSGLFAELTRQAAIYGRDFV